MSKSGFWSILALINAVTTGINLGAGQMFGICTALLWAWCVIMVGVERHHELRRDVQPGPPGPTGATGPMGPPGSPCACNCTCKVKSKNDKQILLG